MSLLHSTRLAAALVVTALLGACAHPISLEPTSTPDRDTNRLIAKKVGYVMTDADRAKQVVTPGGGGDKVSYYPYRDAEKALREALRSVYADVVVLRSATDAQALQAAGVAYVFSPELTTQSSSPSLFTWPPTRFDADLACRVSDPSGGLVASLQASGRGAAEWDEFKTDFSLAARRAIQDLADKFAQAVRDEPRLK